MDFWQLAGSAGLSWRTAAAVVVLAVPVVVVIAVFGGSADILCSSTILVCLCDFMQLCCSIVSPVETSVSAVADFFRGAHVCFRFSQSRCLASLLRS